MSPRPHQYTPPSWPLPIRALAAVSQALAFAEGVGIGACLAAVIGLAIWEFIQRNLVMHGIPFFPVPAWTDGVIRHSVFMLGFLGGAYATYTGRHIRIDAVTRSLSARPRMMLRAFTTLIAIGVVCLFVSAAWDFYRVTLEEVGEASQARQLFTPSRGALIIVIGYATIAFHFFVQLVLDIAWLASRQEPPREWISESVHGGEVHE